MDAIIVYNWLLQGTSYISEKYSLTRVPRATNQFLLANSWAITSGSSAIVNGAIVVGSGAVAGEVSGYVAGYVATGTASGARAAARAGAISGGLFAGADFASQDWGHIGRIGARATAGGISNDMQGRSFKDGFAYNFAYYSAQEWTDHLARKSGLMAYEPERGKLDTIGTRTNFPGGPDDASIFGKGGLDLAMEREGQWRSWYDLPGARAFVTDVSKVHDAMNSWMYEGGYYKATGGIVWDTARDVYSFAGMLPAAAFTAAGPMYGSPVSGHMY